MNADDPPPELGGDGETTMSMLATSGKHPWEDYDKRLEAAKSPLALGSDLFGDAVNLQDGALSFTVTDVSLPGNNALPVAFTRSYRVFNRRDYGDMGRLADWELELPRVSATTAQEWLSSTSGGNRCSDINGVQPPPAGFDSNDYFQGIQLEIPGAGGGELLIRHVGTPKPTDGKTYPWMTEGQVHVSCLSGIDNRTGEGFLAVAPDGTKYWFKWMAQDLLPYMESVSFTQSGGRVSNNFNPRKTSLYATRVEDVAGNWVEYSYGNTWNQPVQLNAITSSDGRTITVTHSGGRVASVSNGTHAWQYQYGTTTSGRGTLTAVILPDASRWTMAFAPFTNAEIDTTRANEMVPGEIYRNCWMNEIPHNISATPVGTLTHPSGATGSFTMALKEHGLSNVPISCGNVGNGDTGWLGGNNPNDDTNLFTIKYYGFTLVDKTITGPGLPGLSWTYAYAADLATFFAGNATRQYPVCTLGAVCYQRKVCNGGPCEGAASTTVTGPNGTWERYTFGNSFKYNEGKLLKVERGGGPSNILETTVNSYDLSLVDQIYPASFGQSQRGNDAYAATYHRPLVKRATMRQGATFTWEILKTCSNGKYCTTEQGHPTSVQRHSTLGFSRTEATAYWNELAKWIIGKPLTVTCTQATPVSDPCSGPAAEAYTYDALGRPLTLATFGKPQYTLGYDTSSAISTGQRGTLRTYKDGRNHVTTLTSWHRGVPRLIQYPDETSVSATVNGNGTIASTIDENGFATGYQYDPVGRITKITWPAGDTPAWNATNISYSQMTTAQYGLAAGHWRQMVQTGNGVKVTYFDGLMRPAITHEYDSGDQAGTQRFVRTSHNHDGRNTFTSYPSASSSASAGVETEYDALGRVRHVRQDSELGVLTTTTAYSPTAFQVSVTNPRLETTTTTSFQGWDTPTYDFPLAISHPEGVGTGLSRDAFGKLRAISRAGGGSSLTRTYAYNAQQELCRQVEPETGATLMSYDAAGNLAWSASGLPQSTPCSATGNETAILARKVARTYDTRNRLTGLDFPGANGDQQWTYTPDGLPSEVVTWNDNGTTWVTNAYTYNKRRMLTGESQAENDRDPSYTWAMGYGYSVNGHLATVRYPASLIVDYAPNALGQPTKATSTAQAFATNVSYHPNGAIAQFTYGNGIVHTLGQNARGLPDRSTDAYGTTRFLDDGYDYDHNGNVAAISDGASGTALRGNRTMTYDGLDRLKSVVSPMWGGGTATYDYDALDNMTRVYVPPAGIYPVRNQHLCREDGTNRLTTVRYTSCSGTPILTVSYDVQGNLDKWNTTDYDFDFGNRLRTVRTGAGALIESYRYDAHGRRVRGTAPAGTLFRLYGQNGKLYWTRDERDQQRRQYVYLGGSLIAERTRPIGATTETVTYQHTDALGSPTLRTGQSRAILERLEYEPYGKRIDAANDDAPGYTGHVMDATTGLTYMQQRYYDPRVGQFWSVDPVTAYSTPGSNFNRYWYANNNPYKFHDPDGRLAFLIPVAIIAYRAYSAYDTVTSTIDNAQTLADSTAATGDRIQAGAEIIGGFVGGKAGRQAAGGAVRAARVVDGVGDGSKKAPDFDTARGRAFDRAGMNNPADVEFSKVDPKTGTVVEFKGPGGAKVGYDGPHTSPGPHHDTQHISWQSGGKRGDGGAQRGNEPYSGDRHPSRPDRKDQK